MDTDEEQPVSTDKDKPHTFNDLDERFQITDKHDPEHIFDEEYDMIAELRRDIQGLGECHVNPKRFRCELSMFSSIFVISLLLSLSAMLS
jgi:hypothetical protein